MRLPGYQSTGVQSLGQQDVSGPASVWRAKYQADQAKSEAFKEVGKAFTDIFSAQDEAANLQLLQKRIRNDKFANKETEAYLLNTNVIDTQDTDVPEDLRNYAMDWIDKNANPEVDDLSTVPTYKIMDSYMKHHYEDTRNKSLDALKGTKLEHKYLSSMDDQITTGIQNITAAKAKQQHDYNKLQVDENYNNAINAMDFNAARDIALDAKESGAWSPEEYFEQRTELPARMEFISFSQRLSSDDIGELADAQLDIWHEDSAMTMEQRTQLYNSYDAKIRRLTDSHEKNVKETRQRTSAQKRNDLIGTIIQLDKPIDWPELYGLAQDMEPEDAKFIFEYNKAKSEKRTQQTNDRVKADIQAELLNLAIPSNNPISVRRASIQQKITDALANDSISPQDAATLVQQINTMEQIPYKSEEYKQATDKIYTLLVGGAKESLAFFNESGPNKINAIQAEEALQKAMRDAYDKGEDFSANDWVNDNLTPYMRKSTEQNLDKLSNEKAGKLLVTDKVTAKTDIPKSRDAIKAEWIKLKKGQYTPYTAEELRLAEDKVNKFEAMYDQEDRNARKNK